MADLVFLPRRLWPRDPCRPGFKGWVAEVVSRNKRRKTLTCFVPADLNHAPADAPGYGPDTTWVVPKTATRDDAPYDGPDRAGNAQAAVRNRVLASLVAEHTPEKGARAAVLDNARGDTAAALRGTAKVVIMERHPLTHARQLRAPIPGDPERRFVPHGMIDELRRNRDDAPFRVLFFDSMQQFHPTRTREDVAALLDALDPRGGVVGLTLVQRNSHGLEGTPRRLGQVLSDALRRRSLTGTFLSVPTSPLTLHGRPNRGAPVITVFVVVAPAP